MKTNPLKEGALTEDTAGLGAVIRKMADDPTRGRVFLRWELSELREWVWEE
jgi:hypothetical protein